MKKTDYFLFSLLFILTLFCMSCSTSQYKNMQITLPDITAKNDGIYRGEADFSGTPIKVSLDVVLRNHVIDSINIIRHTSSPIGKKAVKIIDDIIEHQSLDVDVVSGATYSSNAIRKAVENALY